MGGDGALMTVNQVVASDPRYANLTTCFAFVEHSWFTNAVILSHILPSFAPKSICEVGSWMGASARFMASVPSVERVVCVDHWDRRLVENWTPGAHPEDWMDFMYEHFLANCLHAGLGNKMCPVRMTSTDAARFLEQRGEKFDLIYIDGAPASERVREDLRNYYRLLNKGGFFCGDDWSYCREPENVQAEVIAFAKELGCKPVVCGNFWWYHF